MRREYKVLILLFLLAFIVRIFFVFDSPVRIWDETVYSNLGYDLSKNMFHYSLEGASWSDFIPSKIGQPYDWPNMGFRAPLLPYTLALFYFFRLDFLISFFIPFIGALSTVLVYFLGKNLFNKKTGVYSSVFFMLIPLHVLNSGMILTGVYSTFFILLTFISFWEGYEKGNNAHRVLFGGFFALALLARYTVLWFVPVFLVYFLIRDKSLRFLRDKYLWYSIFAFLVVLLPWFFYGQFTYGNPFGAFIHGANAAHYWGGVQGIFFYFKYWLMMFSIVGVLFFASLFYILYKKQFIKREIYLLFAWIILFLSLATYMPHKETRFIIPIIPALCLLSGFFVYNLKKYRKAIFSILIVVLLLSNVFQFYFNYNVSYTNSNSCFLEANEFIEGLSEGTLIITDETTSIYYYTKKQTKFYPRPWSIGRLRAILDQGVEGREIYILFTSYDMPLNNKENIGIKDDLDINFERVFECEKQEGVSMIYRYS